MRTPVSSVLLACLAGVSLASAHGTPASASASASSPSTTAAMTRPAQAAPPPATGASAAAQKEAGPQTPPSIADRVKRYKRIDGFVPIYWDEESGKLWMEISRFDTELLYQTSLAAGLGSNPVGLDRGALGDTHVVTFQRVGPKVLLVEPNYRYRAISQDAAEQRAVRDSFAQSVLWGFKVDAADTNRVLVDATGFFLRDAYGAIDRLRQTRQGSYRFDESRSAFYLPRTKGFPKNTEIETTLTFTTDGDPGNHVSQVTPTAQVVTLREHHSFIELPALGPQGYKPRVVDPRVGVFGIEFNDYASGITEPIEKRWVVRHRLEKKDPSAAMSEPVQPIVYYVDNGAPEPIRSALVEGASWWNEAFEAAGFRNAFQVKVLPADADPLDVRYNVINWVHRSSRGWSYGGSIVDPRTGEILKGHVTLGSLRVRQDYMLGTGMIAPTAAASASGAAGLDGARRASRAAAAWLGAAADDSDLHDGFRGACELGELPETEYLAQATADPATDALAMSVARIRQLSAHEVGHTLGFAHNFAASTYGRGSVMDYPAPQVDIRNGALDLSNAYARGIGSYDKWATAYAYTQVAPGIDERAALEKILQDGVAAKQLYISDADARPAGAAHPLATLWDNGSDPVATLRHEMEVRRIGLSHFGLQNVPQGSSLSLLEAKLLPLYLHHRYQLNAAMKSIGGAYYSYAVRAAGGANPAEVQRIVAPATQRDALKAVLATITPDALDIPDSIVALIPPTTFGFGSTNTELFDGRTNPTFDPLAAAGIAADLAISGLLQPQRAGRLVSFHARETANPDFDEVLQALIGQVWRQAPGTSARHEAIQGTVQHLLVTRLMELAADDRAMPQVRADATAGLRRIDRLAAAPATASPARTRLNRALRDDIDRFLKRPDATFKQVAPLPTPPGDPIGAAGR